MSRTQFEALEGRRLMAGSVLFVRGAERSGGFLEATNDTQRTEQLADINNNSTAAGNHGWGQLAALLRRQGYTVSQVAERLEPDAPPTGQTNGIGLTLTDLNLSQYAAVVMGSNNADYGAAQIEALHAYVRGGGGVLFIPDGNFGSNWSDAPDSDNQFLSRYGLTFNQDNGTYAVSRTAGDFTLSREPVLIGVDAFDGEGVSPVRLTGPGSDGTARRVSVAKGTTFDNSPISSANNFRGASRPVDDRDASLALVPRIGAGRVAAYFDRNTFFNRNGAGTDLTRNDNTQLATNLFDWVTDASPPAVTSSDFATSTRTLTFRTDDNLRGTLARENVRLRNRRTGENIASRDWSLSLAEGNGYTDVTIRISGNAAAGPYQLRVPRATIADDSGNVRSGAIRYAFTVMASARTTTPGATAFARPTAAFGRATRALAGASDPDELLR